MFGSEVDTSTEQSLSNSSNSSYGTTCLCSNEICIRIRMFDEIKLNDLSFVLFMSV